jgi:hypothetical protein
VSLLSGLVLPALPAINTAKLAGGLALLLALSAAGAGLYLKGRSDGAAPAEAKLAQAEAALAQHALEQLQANEHRGADASAAYQAADAAAAAALPEIHRALHQDLRAPAACPTGPGVPGPAAGDLRVPAAAVQRLRDAASGRTSVGASAPG